MCPVLDSASALELGSRAGASALWNLHPPAPDFVVQRSGLGFSIHFPAESATPPMRVSLKVAYETPRGNPLSSYSAHDFVLHGEGALDIEPTAAE